MNDIKMYNQARVISEPEFVNVLERHSFTDIKQADSELDKTHVDVIGIFNDIRCVFDVKDLTKKYLDSTRYNMSTAMYADIERNKGKYRHHYIACRLYENNKPTGKYFIFKTLDAFKAAKLFYRHDNNKHFYLFDIKDCMKLFDYRIFD